MARFPLAVSSLGCWQGRLLSEAGDHGAAHVRRRGLGEDCVIGKSSLVLSSSSVEPTFRLLVKWERGMFTAKATGGSAFLSNSTISQVLLRTSDGDWATAKWTRWACMRPSPAGGRNKWCAGRSTELDCHHPFFYTDSQPDGFTMSGVQRC